MERRQTGRGKRQGETRREKRLVSFVLNQIIYSKEQTKPSQLVTNCEGFVVFLTIYWKVICRRKKTRKYSKNQ